MLRRGGGFHVTIIKAKQAVFINLFRSTTDYMGLIYRTSWYVNIQVKM